MPYVGFAFTNSALDFLAGLQPKVRRQIIKRAKALHTNPFPQGVKKLHDVATPEGDPVYRERSGDYRILYVVRSQPAEVLILDIDNRKDVYRMPKVKTEPADEMRMSEAEFDDVMGRALGVSPPPESAVSEDSPKRLSAHPRRKKN